jgi:hypothetical protein
MEMSEKTEHVGHQDSAVPAALSRAIHLGIPIASIVVLLAFALVLFLPSDKDAIPPTSTQIYIPVYLVIVVVLVFGSMYLFKRLFDTEVPSTAH